MIIHSKTKILSTPIKKVEKKEVKVEVEEKTATKKNKKIKEEPILPIEDDFSLIEEEYNS